MIVICYIFLLSSWRQDPIEQCPLFQNAIISAVPPCLQTRYDLAFWWDWHHSMSEIIYELYFNLVTVQILCWSGLVQQDKWITCLKKQLTCLFNVNHKIRQKTHLSNCESLDSKWNAVTILVKHSIHLDSDFLKWESNFRSVNNVMY